MVKIDTKKCRINNKIDSNNKYLNLKKRSRNWKTI